MKHPDIGELPTRESHPVAPPADQRPSRRVKHECEIRVTQRRPAAAERAGDIDASPELVDWAVMLTVEVVEAAAPSGQYRIGEGDGERIAGSGDRAHHLAMAPGRAIHAPRPPAPAREALVMPLRPKTRAECRRRCGKAGACDPSSDLGCGGEYCGNTWLHEDEKL